MSARELCLFFSILPFFSERGGGETPPPSTAAERTLEGRLGRLAEREAALASLLAEIERGAEIPLYQVLLLATPSAEESVTEAEIASELELLDAIRKEGRERAAAREKAPAPAAPPPAPDGGSEAAPAAPPPREAAPAPPAEDPMLATDTLLAIGGPGAADILLATGRCAEAISIYDVLAASPKTATESIRFRRALCLEKLGRNDEAIAAFEQIANDPRSGALGAESAFAARHIRFKVEHAAAMRALLEEKE